MHGITGLPDSAGAGTTLMTWAFKQSQTKHRSPPAGH